MILKNGEEVARTVILMRFQVGRDRSDRPILYLQIVMGFYKYKAIMQNRANGSTIKY